LYSAPRKPVKPVPKASPNLPLRGIINDVAGSRDRPKDKDPKEKAVEIKKRREIGPSPKDEDPTERSRPIERIPETKATHEGTDPKNNAHGFKKTH
jgi:hypothetical protein